MELAFLSAVGRRDSYVRGVSSTELVRLCLERIARLDSQLNAFVTRR
jgi:Asp-tRNA(Asn)/Glu-tRNA(Gln) amidotransferase A subunit family amidase